MFHSQIPARINNRFELQLLLHFFLNCHLFDNFKQPGTKDAKVFIFVKLKKKQALAEIFQKQA
jgi:hypothetical protein